MKTGYPQTVVEKKNFDEGVREMPKGRSPQHRNRISELRQLRGMSETQLARAYEPPVDVSVISRLENGGLPLTQDRCYRLAKPLGCRPWDFFPEVTEMPIAEQIAALWSQLDAVGRADLLPRLLDPETPRITLKPDDPKAGKFADLEVRDDGVYATLYYRQR